MDGGVEEGVEPVEGGLEVEIVPEAVAVDEGVGASGLLGGQETAQTVELVVRDGEADHLFDLDEMVNCGSSRKSCGTLTDDIDLVGRTC